MADWQHAFLSKVILEHEMRSAVTANITTAFFRDERYQRVYEFLTDHYGRYGTPPDEDVVRQAFPTMEWKPQRQALGYLIDQMRRDRMFVILTQGLSRAADFIEGENAVNMQQALQEALTQARTETSASYDLDFTADRSLIEERFMERMESPGLLRGISTGFSGIDYVTGGLQPEQFVVLAGTPKSFKSATLLAMALAVHQQGKVPLFVGFEMSNVEQIDRAVSLLSGVGLSKLINGAINAKEFKKVSMALSKLESMRSFVFSSDIASATTVSGIQAKIQEYQPDVVFVDGAYLMQSEMTNVQQGSPQALTDISRSLKRLAQQQKLPVVVTTQASLARSSHGVGIGSVMYTQAFGQDCDVLLSVQRKAKDKDKSPEEDEEDAGAAIVMFKVTESRSGPRKQVLLEWDWGNGSVTEIDVKKMREMLNSRSKHSYMDDVDENWRAG